MLFRARRAVSVQTMLCAGSQPALPSSLGTAILSALCGCPHTSGVHLSLFSVARRCLGLLCPKHWAPKATLAFRWALVTEDQHLVLTGQASYGAAQQNAGLAVGKQLAVFLIMLQLSASVNNELEASDDLLMQGKAHALLFDHSNLEQDTGWQALLDHRCSVSMPFS